jgi:hypothetical protein
MLGACLYVFILSSTVDLPITVPRWAWLVAAGVASGLALLVGTTMAVTDFALLKLKLREPPTGWRVWAMGIAAPLPVLFLWQKLIKFAITGVPQFLLVLFAPMLGVALVARFVLGTRPESWKS